MQSWLELPNNTDFTIYNFPFGIGSIDGQPTVVSRLGIHIINTSKLVESGLVTISNPDVLKSQYLNDYMALGKIETVPFREKLIEIFTNDAFKEKAQSSLVPANDVPMLLPIKITDYTDFYSSIEHATNVGTMFRDPNNALLPNWLHLPVGYHGRASSIVVSGTEIQRPHGQTKPNEDEGPVFGPTKLLDFELEMGFVIGKGTELGQRVSTENAEDHIFGLSLFNDWSARDIQKWEYVPLGPFLAKNFASTMSPWIIPLEALEPFRVPGPKQDPEVLEYLQYSGNHNFDVDLYVDIETSKGTKQEICHSNFKYMYWNMTQQLAHQTVTGCNISVGDLYASGTISGKDESSYGSMLELTWRGSKPIHLEDGETRKFIQDGDTISLRGRCSRGEIVVGFGECKGKIIPNKN